MNNNNDLTFDQLMTVINGEVKMKGQSGEPTTGAAQSYYFGTRFGKNLGFEELAQKLEEKLVEVTRHTKCAKIVLDGIQPELEKSIAEKIDKKAIQFENYSVENLDAMIAKLQAMKDAKIA